MTSSPRVRLGVLNDHPVITAGVASLLEPYRDTIEVRQYLKSIPPGEELDVVLFDAYSVPFPALATRLARVQDATSAKIVVFSWARHQGQIEVSVKAGAAGFVAKSVTGDELARSIIAVRSGETVLAVPDPDPDADAEAETGAVPAWPGADHGLSARESEILVHIGSGVTNQEIADAMYLSINSIKSYIRSAYRKIGVTHRSQAVVWAIDHDLRA